MMKNQNYSCKA